MKLTFKNTAVAAAILAGAFTTAASANIVDAVKVDLKNMGFSTEVISQLSDAELNQIDSAANGESASDAAQTIKSWVLHFTG